MPGQDIVPIDSSSSSQQDELTSLGGQGEAEGMDIQQSETSQSSATDPQSSELERNDGSTSSLSLSSERLEEGGIVALPPLSDGSLMTSRRPETASASMLGSRTITILPSSSTNSSSSTQQQTATFLQSLGSELSSLASYEQAASSPHLESSVDPSSSQLSLDSSNGSSSQGDVSQSEIEAEEGLRFTAGTRTSSDSNLPSQAGPVERTSSTRRSSSSIGGTSVIVEPSNSRGTPSSSSSSRERSGGAGEGQQQRPSQPPPTDDGAGNSSSRPTGPLVHSTHPKVESMWGIHNVHKTRHLS